MPETPEPATPKFLYSECPECKQRRGPDEEQIIPCPECGNAEVENVWSDGQRSDALADAEVDYVL